MTCLEQFLSVAVSSSFFAYQMQRRRYINGLIKYKQTGLSKVQFSRCNTAVARCFQCRTSGPTNENNEDLNEFCLLFEGQKDLVRT